MSGTIMDSPWARLMEKCYENRGNYPVDTTDDENPALDKSFKELKAEIQAERIAKKKQSRVNKTE